MPDQRSAMKEYRILEQKRLVEGLSPDEQARLARLRNLVGTEAAPAASGFDVSAAAARLRESLLPAGLRNRPPPEPEPEPAALESFEAEPAPEPGLGAGALGVAWQDAPFAPMEAGAPAADPYFDPASLGGDPGQAAYDPGAEQAWDPNGQPYDPNAEAAYDPNAAQAWDPNAQPYDPNAAAAYDPNAAQAWDPNAQPYDPNAAAAYDPNAAQAWDPNAQPYDPNAAAAYDPNAAQAWDPNAQPYDPNAAAAYDPNAAQPWDPNAQPYDPNAAAAYDPNAAQPWDPNAQPYDPNAAAAYDPNAVQPWDPNAQPYDPNAAAGSDPNAAPGWDPNAVAYAAPAEGDALAFDPALQPLDLDGTEAPLDPNAGAPAQSWDTGAGWEAGAAAGEPGLGFDALAGALDAGHDPSAEPAPALDGSGFPPLALGAYDDPDATPLAPEAAEPDFGLSSELPFDPAAVAMVETGDLAEPLPDGAPALGAYDDLSAFERAPTAQAGDLPADGPGFHAASAVGEEAALWQPDAALEEGFRLESGGSFAGPGAEGDAGAVPLELGASAELTDVTELSDADLSEVPEPVSELAPLEDDPYAAAPTAEPSAEALSYESLSFDAEAEPAEPPEPAPEAISFEAELPEEPAAAPVAFEVGHEAEAEPEPAAPAPVHAEIHGAPTIDGEEILEELPPEAAPPAPEPPAPLAPAPIAEPPPEAGSRVQGVHRVVVHTLDGQVKRGVLESPDLAAAVLGLAPQPGGSPEVLGTDKVKAIFFMLAPGDKAPAPEGHRVRVTFRDGRQVAGFSPDYSEGTVGFFMVPADTRTNTGRIWVYRAAVRQVSVS